MYFMVGIREVRSVNNMESIDFRCPVVLFLRHTDARECFAVFPYFHSITATMKLTVMNIMF